MPWLSFLYASLFASVSLATPTGLSKANEGFAGVKVPVKLEWFGNDGVHIDRADDPASERDEMRRELDGDRFACRQ